ncbi:MAG: hypothetical protein IKM61_01175 [Eubacteriaceae bacterium]|nr:hypothetical protein [Eubacteriaceae bacterium]
MKYIKGKLLSIVLLCLCMMMFIILSPKWLSLTFIGFGILYCLVSMIKTGFFG